MPSRLSSLLVRDGLVGVKRMEKAFQRQVIYGGSLDTILLEMSLVSEDRLTQYLALASGLPPAARDEGSTIDDAESVIPLEIAEQYRAVPLAVAGDAVRVLVCAPLEINELEDLADQLDRPLQPLITPEYRWHLVYAAAYGIDPPARFTTLERSLYVEALPAPVGRAKTIIIDESSRGHSTGAPVSAQQERTARTPALADTTTRGPSAPLRTPADTAKPHEESAVVEGHPDAPNRSSRDTLIGHTPNRAATDPGLPVRSGTHNGGPEAPGGVPLVVPDEDSIILPHLTSAGIPRTMAGSRPSKRVSTQPVDISGRDAIAVHQAREILATAEDRDTIFLTLLRAARSRARFAALLTVQGGAAIGRVALAEPGVATTAVTTVLIPLDVMSVFRTVVTNRQPYIGPVVSGDPNVDSMVLRMGGTMPPSALLLPVVIGDRVVALVVAHRTYSDVRLVDVTELLPLANAASEAIGRLLVKHKSAGYRAPTQQATVGIEVELIETKKITRQDEPWQTPEQPALPMLEDALDVSITAEPRRPIDDVLDEIERAGEGQAQDAITEAVERAGEVIRSLTRRFPGKLRVDRFAVSGRPLRAAQYGGLLELVISLGSAASDLLIAQMGATDHDARFYATLCAAELRPRNAMYALADRLFDQDFGVRASAIEALSGYPTHDLDQAMARARRGVHSSDPEVVAAATAAIVALSDTEAIADLIGAIERSDRAGDHARKALVALTAQDFGGNERKWRKWWEHARKLHRIEWLIDGLVHKEDAIRETAINDLRRLTGEYFGYHHDLPRRERDAAAAKWQTWWKDIGQRRFVHLDD